MKRLKRYRDYEGGEPSTQTGGKKVAKYSGGKRRGLNERETTRDDENEYKGRTIKGEREEENLAALKLKRGRRMHPGEAPWHDHWDGGSATAEEERPYGHDKHLNTPK